MDGGTPPRPEGETKMNATETKFSKVILANMTGEDLRGFDHVFLDAVRNGGVLPPELADLFTMTLVEVEDGIRGVIRFA
jgi:hypothetical protein